MPRRAGDRPSGGSERPATKTGPANDKGPLGRTPPDASDERSLQLRSSLLLFGIAGLLACLLTFGLLAQVIQRQELDALDRFASPFLHGLASPPLDFLMNAATFVGTDVTLIAIAAVVTVWLFWRGRRRESTFIVAVLGGSVIANLAMKLFFHRARPMLPWAHVLPDYSFPSGHSMNSLALGLALTFAVWRILGTRWGVVALAIAVIASLTIGVSRIYLGYHYLTDVVGGFLAAILWVAFVVGVFRLTRLAGLQRLVGRPSP